MNAINTTIGTATVSTARFIAEIERRGGERGILTTPYGAGRSKSYWIDVAPVSAHEGCTLLRAEGWRYYSRRTPVRRSAVAYLCGVDDSGVWAVRVPSTCTSAQVALAWLEPPIVRWARADGRPVLRQGNLYAVQTARGTDSREDRSIGRHTYHARARVITHPEHAPVVLPAGRWTFATQKSLSTSRGAASD